MKALELIERLKEIVNASGKNLDVEISIESNDGWFPRNIDAVSVVGSEKNKTIWLES